MLLHGHTHCLVNGCTGTLFLPSRAHAVLPRMQRFKPSATSGDITSEPDYGSSGHDYNSSSSNDRSATSAAGQQKNAWGSSWSKKPKSFVNKTVSYFSKSNMDGNTETDVQQSDGDTTTTTAAHLDPQLEASIRQNVDRAAETLQDIITEVLNEMLLEEASSYVMAEQGPSLPINQAVRNAVIKRLEWLDANFLAALNAYLAAPSVQHNDELSELLRAVRTEVLDLVAARLPPAVQVLNAALQHNRKAGRAAIVQIALAGGEGSVPAASLDALGAAAHQLVDDMEDQQMIADRVLLARLVLLREELRMRAEQQDAQQFWIEPQKPIVNGDNIVEIPASSSSPNVEQNSSEVGHAPPNFYGFHRSNLPVRCATFMKELLSVPERDRRLGLLSKAFQEDWVGEAPTSNQGKDMASASKHPRDSNHQDQTRSESLDIVRPGRFLSTLHAMRAELEHTFVASTSVQSGAPDMQLLQSFDVVLLEALVALDRVQSSRVSDDTGPRCDYEVELSSSQ